MDLAVPMLSEGVLRSCLSAAVDFFFFFLQSPSPPPCPQQPNWNVQGAGEETFHLDRGLDLVVSGSGTGLQRVANLLLAANRMKKLGRLCSDAQLCDAIMDDVVQGGQ